MPNNGQKIIFTTISIDKETGNLEEKICKRYSLKKAEVVKLAFRYIDKASINPAEAPESVKAELSKINKRQDDIIRFIKHYEEKELNPMIRATNSIAVCFDGIVKALETLVLSQLEKNQDKYNAVLQRISDKFGEHADVINGQGKHIGALKETQKKDNAKLLKLISLYADLATCGVIMNIDFPPPSNGVYNNAGSSRQLANYMENEDLQRMEQGIYTEGFFNFTDDNVYKSQVIKDIDGNIGQLLKTDAKFYAVHVSPSEKELQAMGSTEQELASAMKRYIRKVFIPEYARNFNKGLSAEDIKFYGKIHFSRDRSDNRLNMHCHLIVSRKDQSNKVKISPLTNHRNTKQGVITGGFDRTTLFENVEKGFDKLFGYNRQLSETFEYCNTMKNGSMTDKLRMQERELKAPEQNFAGEKKNTVDV